MQAQSLYMDLENIATMTKALCNAWGIGHISTSGSISPPHAMEILEVEDHIGCNDARAADDNVGGFKM